MNKIGRLLSIIGIILILVPVIGNLILHCRQERLYKDYLKSNLTSEFFTSEGNAPEDSFNNEEKELKNQEKLNDLIKANDKISDEQDNISSQAKDKQDENKELSREVLEEIVQGDVIGKIKIDSVGVDLILLQGVSDHEIKLGAGHMIETEWPGEDGNCVIAGHRNYTFGSMFNRLDEVKVDDEVEIEFLGNHYNYIVNEIKIVEPDDLSVLVSDESKKELTLITCHPLYSGTHRLIIKGILSE